MDIAKVTSKGQVTVPKSVREKLELETGSKMVFIQVGDDLVVRNAKSLVSPDISRSDDLKARFLAEAAAKYDLDLEEIQAAATSKSVSQLLDEVRASFMATIEEKGLETEEEILDYFGLPQDDHQE